MRGWTSDNQPIWQNQICRDQDGRPEWGNWNEARDTLLRPLCAIAQSISLFGNEWLSDSEEVARVRDFVNAHFHDQKGRLTCAKPLEIVEAPLFWTGGNSRWFHLIKVFEFDLESLDAVLAILVKHQHAGISSARSGGVWTKINSYARRLVKHGSLGLIWYGKATELWYPMTAHDQVMDCAAIVTSRGRQEMLEMHARMKFEKD